MNEVMQYENLQELIVAVREQLVLLDADVAGIYSVTTRDINKAVANNPEKFPEGYVIELSKMEKMELVENFHRFNQLKHSTVLPKAFTEKGLYMLATILKSKQATTTTLMIIETFAKIRELTRTVKTLSEIPAKKKQKALLEKSGKLIAEVLDGGLTVNNSETTIELNFAMLKFKQTLRKKAK